jgi:hypothetical protein
MNKQRDTDDLIALILFTGFAVAIAAGGLALFAIALSAIL